MMMRKHNDQQTDDSIDLFNTISFLRPVYIVNQLAIWSQCMSEENKFEIGNKAEKLYFSVFDITTNRSHYPIKYRRMADKMQECVLTIHSDVLNANLCKADSQQSRLKRYDLQTNVIAKCNTFESLVKYCMHARLISFATGEEWTRLVRDIKYMTLAWRKT